MPVHYTIDHERIRTWIEEHGGQPAVVKGTTNEHTPGSLRIVFTDPDGTFDVISWEEFLGIFEDRRLRFRYEDDVQTGFEGWSCGFEDRSQTHDSIVDETQLPEDAEAAEENMFPSAP